MQGPIYRCLVVHCKEQVTHTDENVVVALLNVHINTHTIGANREVDSVRKKREKFTELKSSKGMSMNSWKSI